MMNDPTTDLPGEIAAIGRCGYVQLACSQRSIRPDISHQNRLSLPGARGQFFAQALQRKFFRAVVVT